MILPYQTNQEASGNILRAEIAILQRKFALAEAALREIDGMVCISRCCTCAVACCPSVREFVAEMLRKIAEVGAVLPPCACCDRVATHPPGDRPGPTCNEHRLGG